MRSLTPAGGTRFIGVYLARQLIEEGHQVTLLTRGKKPVTFKIPDDTDSSFASYEKAIQHIAADRSEHEGFKQAISGKGFDGRRFLSMQIVGIRCMSDACRTLGCS